MVQIWYFSVSKAFLFSLKVCLHVNNIESSDNQYIDNIHHEIKYNCTPQIITISERKETNQKLDNSTLNWFIRYVFVQYNCIILKVNIYILIVAGKSTYFLITVRRQRSVSLPAVLTES